MSAILTLVASQSKKPINKAHFKEMGEIAKFYNYELTGKPAWLEGDKAADIVISDMPSTALIAHFREKLDEDKIDLFITEPGNRTKKLLLADMDSTIVAEETLDELAAFADLKEKVAEITARAMNGELDFHGAVRERVGLLKGLSTDALDKTLEATTVNPGARVLVKTMQAHDATCVLVSGGFTFFTHYDSRKGEEIAANPKVSFTMFWQPFDRQMIVIGEAHKVDQQESDSYFASRPYASQISAAISPQSRPASRAWLEDEVARLEQAFPSAPVPRPAQWGGYRIVAHEIQFWHGRPSRLHDRFRYQRQEDGSWLRERLAP